MNDGGLVSGFILALVERDAVALELFAGGLADEGADVALGGLLNPLFNGLDHGRRHIAAEEATVASYVSFHGVVFLGAAHCLSILKGVLHS